MALLRSVVVAAQDRGELADDADAGHLAFQLNPLLVGANTSFVLHDDPTVLDVARAVIDDRLSALAPVAPRPRRIST
jgi:hypothetical protein